MPTINITKTVSNLASVTGLSFTATATQGSNVFPLTATYSAPNLTLTSAGSVGVSGNFTFNVVANYTAYGTACSDNISFVEELTNSFNNLNWDGQINLPNRNAPFTEDNVGSFFYNFNDGTGADLVNNDTNQFLTLKAGNDEAIFEFWYEFRAPRFSRVSGSQIIFTDGIVAGKRFGFGNGGCDQAGIWHMGALQMAVRTSTPLENNLPFTYDMNISGNNVFTGTFSTYLGTYNVGYTDLSYINLPYPKTKFKIRTINGNYELYKTDVLVGTLAYDNTRSYNIKIVTNNTNTVGSYTNTSIQLIKVEGNFQ